MNQSIQDLLYQIQQTLHRIQNHLTHQHIHREAHKPIECFYYNNIICNSDNRNSTTTTTTTPIHAPTKITKMLKKENFHIKAEEFFTKKLKRISQNLRRRERERDELRLMRENDQNIWLLT